MDDGLIVTTLDARANFGKLLRRVEDEGRSFVIDETGQSARCYSASGIMYVWRFLNPRFFESLGRNPNKKAPISSAGQIDQIVKAARRSKHR